MLLSVEQIVEYLKAKTGINDISLTEIVKKHYDDRDFESIPRKIKLEIKDKLNIDY